MSNLQIATLLLIFTHAGCIGLGILLALYWKSAEVVNPKEEVDSFEGSLRSQKKW